MYIAHEVKGWVTCWAVASYTTVHISHAFLLAKAITCDVNDVYSEPFGSEVFDESV